MWPCDVGMGMGCTVVESGKSTGRYLGVVGQEGRCFGPCSRFVITATAASRSTGINGAKNLAAIMCTFGG